MSVNLSPAGIVARAALSSYFVLSGIWFVFAIGYGVLALEDPGHGMHVGGLVAFSIGLLWVLWLRGFRLRITVDQIEYRNGFYHSVAVPLREITEVKNTWVEWKLLGRHLRVPRLIIVHGSQGDRVVINTKPFSKGDLQLALRELRTK